ncbi:hypothetical protein [Rubrolithibacter danxiaensis]|uniref:hypothetical protein n=1 Tax=Rubrolithibacter danxiaensis TaxID=3390805 RepID=UPI003BF7DDF2
MVEVFITNVRKASHAKALEALLLQHFPESSINFDLDDCDKILRIEGGNFLTEKVEVLVKESGFMCEVLE